MFRLYKNRVSCDARFLLLITTHYPEILDEYDRNDSIHIIRNKNGIAVENLANILKRNDIKKSEAWVE